MAFGIRNILDNSRSVEHPGMKPGQKAREKGEILASAPEILLTFNLKISMALIQGEECMLSHS